MSGMEKSRYHAEEQFNDGLVTWAAGAIDGLQPAGAVGNCPRCSGRRGKTCSMNGTTSSRSNQSATAA